MNTETFNPWYKSGLPFKCTECGQCCTGSPGFIWVTDLEIISMAEFLNISTDKFKRLYLRIRNNRFALVEKKVTKDCIFLKDKKCTVYNARPTQCRTFPWWQENLKSIESWKVASQSCEGINDQAPIVPFDEIQTMLESNQVD